jgi:hypothetical protein
VTSAPIVVVSRRETKRDEMRLFAQRPSLSLLHFRQGVIVVVSPRGTKNRCFRQAFLADASHLRRVLAEASG